MMKPFYKTRTSSNPGNDDGTKRKEKRKKKDDRSRSLCLDLNVAKTSYFKSTSETFLRFKSIDFVDLSEKIVVNLPWTCSQHRPLVPENEDKTDGR